ncbi:MAG TPA: TonB-dependent receptor [Bacteroidales bacterium]
MKINLSYFVTFILLFSVALAFGEGSNTKDGYTISGFISDNSTGEKLPGATVFVASLGKGAASNNYGFYSITIPKGNYELKYSFIGYANTLVKIQLRADTTINIELAPSAENLSEVEILGEGINENVSSAQMSIMALTSQTIASIPAFMGEVDIIKALQLLPGVKFVAEGTSGFSVRGGSPDQNLVLLDEAQIYNAGHLLGFFSVFNNDAIQNVQLYKGDLPAQYGGRLASLVDVSMKEGNNKQFHGAGGIGLISSRLMLEGPIVKDKASFMVAGRRTYADLFLKLSPNEDINDNALYFYDMNAKANYAINQNNHLYISGYFGKDVFKNDDFKMNWGNATGTLRWNHIFNERLFSNFTFIASKFNYSLGVPEGGDNAFLWESALTDYNLKGDFTWFLNNNNKITFGFSSIYHDIFPGTLEGLGESPTFGKYSIPSNYALESGVYISNEQNIGPKVTIKYGIRLSSFSNVGPGTVYEFDSLGYVNDSSTYASGDFYNTYFQPEPRVGIVYKFTETASVKASYSRNAQYIQQASNSTGGSPFNIWFPASPNVLPQIGDQVALGFFKNFKEGMFETSVEGYYKWTKNAVDFVDHADLLLNQYLEGEILSGKGYGYGAEFFVKKAIGDLTGWVSYTWSRTFKEVPGINNNDPYPASYDRPNDLSIVVNYNFKEQLSFGLNWVYLTGMPVTFPVGRYEYGNTIVPVYSARNSYRLPDYHRLDLSITWREKSKPEKRWHSEVNFSIYNLYYRKNPWVVNFVNDVNNPYVTYAEMTYLFGVIPSVTYNFRF